MELKPEKLESHLKQTLLPVYFAFGSEPLLVQESTSLIKAYAKKKGFCEWQTFEVSNKQFDWDPIMYFFKSGSLFSNQKGVDLRIEEAEIGAIGSKSLRALLDILNDKRLLLISAGAVKQTVQKTAWFQDVAKKGAVIMHWPVAALALPEWINQRALSYGISLSKEQSLLLAKNSEGNLLAAKQELEKLALLENPDEVEQYFIQSSQYTVYALADAALAGNKSQCYKILNTLKLTGTEPSLCLWSLTTLLREWGELIIADLQGESLSKTMHSLGVYKKKQSLYHAAFKRLSRSKIYKLLQDCTTIDECIKTGLTPQAWQGLVDLVLEIAA